MRDNVVLIEREAKKREQKIVDKVNARFLEKANGVCARVQQLEKDKNGLRELLKAADARAAQAAAAVAAGAS